MPQSDRERNIISRLLDVNGVRVKFRLRRNKVAIPVITKRQIAITFCVNIFFGTLRVTPRSFRKKFNETFTKNETLNVKTT